MKTLLNLFLISLALACPEVFSEVRVDILESGEIKAEIFTERLYMRSVQPGDKANYEKLMGNPINMEKYADGPRTPEVVELAIEYFVAAWKKGNPFSGFAVFLKDQETFVGHVAIGVSDTLGAAELAYLFDHLFWNQRYGTEVVNAMMKDYVPFLVRGNYPVNRSIFTQILATVRPDNLASERLLLRQDFSNPVLIQKFGAERLLYSRSVDREQILSDH